MQVEMIRKYLLTVCVALTLGLTANAQITDSIWTDDDLMKELEMEERAKNAKKAEKVLAKAIGKGSKGNVEEAYNLLNEAISLDSTNATLYYNRAFAQSLRYHVKEAIKDYSKAIELDSRYTNAYLSRGLS